VASSAHDFEVGLFYLRRYLAREGNLDVPIGHVESGFALDQWVTMQRELYRRGELALEEMTALVDLPGWCWEAPRIARGVFHFRRFVAREGHAAVPPGHREHGFPLYAWLAKQRFLRRHGRLAAETARLLEAVPGWTWSPMDERFQSGLARLRQFVAREGHCDVPKRHVEGGYRLGRWLSRQRELHERGELAPERVAALDAVASWRWPSPPAPRP